jgi:hypothetical protein
LVRRAPGGLVREMVWEDMGVFGWELETKLLAFLGRSSGKTLCRA